MLKVEQLVFKEILDHSSHTQIPALKKLKDNNHYYRIRGGDYRIDVKIINDEKSFERIYIEKKSTNKFPRFLNYYNNSNLSLRL